MHTLLEQRQAVTDVMASYAASIDDRDHDGLRALFEPDVEVTGFSREAITGVDAWIEFASGMLERFRATQHMLGPTLATLDGNAAEARTELRAHHWLPDPADGVFVLWGSYRTGLVRTPHSALGWRIARHGIVVWGTETRK